MQNLTAIIIIAILGAVIPAGVVFVALWSRIISHKADIDSAKLAAAGIVTLQERMLTVENNQKSIQYSMSELEEQLGRLNARWSARDRHDQNAEKKAAKEAEEAAAAAAAGDPPAPDLPRFEQLSMFPAPDGIKQSGKTLIVKAHRYKLKQGG